MVNRKKPKIQRRNFKSEHSFGVVPVYIEEGEPQFLLIQMANMGHWAFPKGHKNAINETDIDAARRELLEETGIEEIRIDETNTFTEKYFYRRAEELIKKQATYFVGFVIDKRVTLQPEEVSEYQWVSSSQARSLITYPATKKMFQEVLDYIYSKA